MRTAGLAREVIHGALHHRLNGEAAKTAYYLFLSLFFPSCSWSLRSPASPAVIGSLT